MTYVVQELRHQQIQVIVAPYEADAQLTYLVKNNLADFVITEDSDLLAFGCSKVCAFFLFLLVLMS